MQLMLGYFSGDKLPWREFYPSLPLLAEVKNVRSCISTPQYVSGSRVIKNKGNFALSPFLPLLTLQFFFNFYCVAFLFQLSYHFLYFSRYFTAFHSVLTAFFCFLSYLLYSFDFHCLSNFCSSCWTLLDACCRLSVNHRTYQRRFAVCHYVRITLPVLRVRFFVIAPAE